MATTAHSSFPGTRWNMGEQAVVLEQAAQVRDMSARAGGVQTVVAKRNVTGGQAGQQRLGFGDGYDVRTTGAEERLIHLLQYAVF